MRADIHPEYFTKAKITCACGSTFVAGSTRAEISIELCSACHPFYTGKQKTMDTARRVDKFQKRMELKTTTAAVRSGKRVKKAKAAAQRKAKADARGAER